MWSQFSRLTGSVLRELPPGLRQAVSGTQVTKLHHTSVSAFGQLCTAVDVSNFPPTEYSSPYSEAQLYFNISCWR